MPGPVFERPRGVEPRRGLDVSSLARSVVGDQRDLPAAHPLDSLVPNSLAAMAGAGQIRDPYARLFASAVGSAAANAVGNESKTLDALSALTIELMLELLDEQGASRVPSPSERRFLAVPGQPTDAPVLLVLDPAVQELSASRRLTDQVALEPGSRSRIHLGT